MSEAQTYYVHITDECRADASRRNRAEDIENLARQICTTQGLPGYASLPGHFRKKKFGAKMRLLAYEYISGMDSLIVFLRLWAKGENELETFEAKHDGNLADPRIAGKYLRYSPEQLADLLSELKQQPPPPSLPAPSDSERGWLDQVQGHADSEDPIFESERWCQLILDPRFSKRELRFHEILASKAFEDLRSTPGGGTRFAVRLCENTQNPQYQILLAIDTHTQDVLLLEPILRDQNSEPNETMLARAEKLIERDCDDEHGLRRLAVRAYPHLIVCDENMWLAIEGDTAGNLALSPEETSLLGELRAGGKVTLPLFINGRAGSGKSTVLAYIAANYIDFMLQHGSGKPLYVTYSDALVERARDVVTSLLTVHSGRLISQERSRNREDIQAAVRECIVTFPDFVRSLLGPTDNPSGEAARSRAVDDDETHFFPSARRIDFSGFRRHWESSFLKQAGNPQVSCALAWHVVRSYIKGCRDEETGELLTPQRFQSLAAKRKSVSQANFDYVYQQVWPWYQRVCEEGGLWDDQDLAWELVQNRDAISDDRLRTAIICDEAQDFTPLEFAAIFGISVFSRRTLAHQDAARVPFIFAGDPLQTVNPTGFRWENVQALVYDAFKKLDPKKRSAGIGISRHDLHFNYRSNPTVVQFCNLIQLVRSVALRDQYVRPQKPWRKADTPVPVAWCDIDGEAARTLIRERPGLIKLVDCDYGDEQGHVSKDVLLPKALKPADQGVYPNVLSPMRSKGLEFPDVILYRFAQKTPKHLTALIRADGGFDDDDSARLEVEYFLNRLYVAASRAKRQLMVMDTKDELSTLWSFATDLDVQRSLIARAPDPKQWGDEDLTSLPSIPAEGWKGEALDTRKQGAEYEATGRAARDPYLMRQAAISYRSAEDARQAALCSALGYEFSGDTKSAGNIYRDELKEMHEALRCFWSGAHFSDLHALANSDPNLAGRIEARVADLMRIDGGSVPQSLLDALALHVADPEAMANMKPDGTWRTVSAKLLQRLAAMAADSDLDWEGAFAMMAKLNELRSDDSRHQLATLAYRANRLDEAKRLWEDSKRVSHEAFYRTQARLSSFPENIKWLSKIPANREVSDTWTAAGPIAQTQVPKAQLREVLEAALSLNDPKVALQVADLLGAAELSDADLPRIAATALKHGTEPEIASMVVLVARTLVLKRQWSRALRLGREQVVLAGANDTRSSADVVFKKTEHGDLALAAVARELAQSEHLSDPKENQRAQVREFAIELSGPPGNYRPHRLVPAEVIGALYECLGTHKETVPYYEWLLKTGNDTEKRFAERRLVVSKEKWAEYDGKESRHRSDALELRKRFGLPNEQELSRFPKPDELPLVRSTKTTPGGTEPERRQIGATPVSIANIEIRFFRQTSRLRLTDNDTGTDVSFDLAATGPVLRPHSEDIQVLPAGDHTWRIEPWQLSVAFTDVHQFELVTAGTPLRFEVEK